MNHVHIFDPQLKSGGGHYLSHDGQLVGELQRRGIPCSVYGRRGTVVPVCGIASHEVFTCDIFEEVAATDAQTWAIENFEKLNRLFHSDLARINPEIFSADHLVYFPNLLQNQLLGIANWLNRLPL